VPFKVITLVVGTRNLRSHYRDDNNNQRYDKLNLWNQLLFSLSGLDNILNNFSFNFFLIGVASNNNNTLIGQTSFFNSSHLPNSHSPTSSILGSNSPANSHSDLLEVRTISYWNFDFDLRAFRLFLNQYDQTWVNDHLRITTPCLSRPSFWGPNLIFCNIKLPLNINQLSTAITNFGSRGWSLYKGLAVFIYDCLMSKFFGILHKM